ncbi:MAG: hypothetical protein M1816_007490 [Peltula sp. TS41687]|nr:MAG: hypothetical protein M1816_007490 [Peltula sp. TS41687]
MIRSFEKVNPSAGLSARVPIFAVSASLVERNREKYIEAGFDGWVLKPIDFKRLQLLLVGILQQDARNQAVYKEGKWERGGWFTTGQPGVFESNTEPGASSPVALSPTTKVKS